MTMSASYQDAIKRVPVSKIYPRFSTRQDTDKIISYYKENAHEHVHQRKRDWIEHHAEKGQFLIFETHDGEIIASSAAYDYAVKVDDPNAPGYYEIGSTIFRKKAGDTVFILL